MAHMAAPDERTGEMFSFRHMVEPCDHPANERHEGCCWHWQFHHLDDWLKHKRAIDLKARQLGDTWLGCGFLLWLMLTQPGSTTLVYRQKEEEAHENVMRAWQLLQSLPKYLWFGAQVIKPTKGATPSGEIRLLFPNGRVSRMLAMTSASASGHGKTAAAIMADEYSRIDAAADIRKAFSAAAGTVGYVLLISTANGRSNPETGEGNDFHFIWTHAEEMGFFRTFLPWNLHPARDDEWYRTSGEITGLKAHERAEQYPANEHEAFTLTNRVFFDPDDLEHYRGMVLKPLYRADFVERSFRQVKLEKERTNGRLRVFLEPNPSHTYAIFADVATGHGRDYSAAYVIDLDTMELCVEYHDRIDADIYAHDLHYLGRWFNTALIAVETQGGYGEPVVLALRDGRAGRPPYPKLYRHIQSTRSDLPVQKSYGWPTNSKTRPIMLSQMKKAIRDRTLPFVTNDLLHEMETFVNHDTGTSPRASEGSRDDRVMACAGALELYRLRGEHENQHRKQASKSTYRHLSVGA